MIDDKLREKTEETQRRWERFYSWSSIEELPWEENGPSSELISLIESGVVEKGAALDICCGSGNNAIYLANHGFTSYGIDISPTAINHAQEKVAIDGASCELTVCNAINLPYPNSTFALVFDRGGFHTIPPEDRETFIRGIHRVLKSTGKYQLICFSIKDHYSTKAPYAFSPENIEHYFSSLFKIHHIREFAHQTKGTKRLFLSSLMEK